tara:strand:+ start:34 stop:294 length:261 start_codon:yes stop_codon:yes gene_type:complete
MNKKFLDKVVDQIVSETRIDYNELSPTLYTPFPYPPLIISFSTFPPRFLFSSFTNHCRDVYGLNDGEIIYVWKKYVNIIKDKIKNG